MCTDTHIPSDTQCSANTLRIKGALLRERLIKWSRFALYFTFHVCMCKTHSCSVSTPISLYCSSCLIWASSCLSLESCGHNSWNYNVRYTHAHIKTLEGSDTNAHRELLSIRAGGGLESWEAESSLNRKVSHQHP